MTTLPEDWVSKFCFYFHCLGESKCGVHGEFSERGVWNTCLPLFPSLPSLVPWGGGERGRVCGRAIANLNRRDLWLSSGHRVGTYFGGGGGRGVYDTFTTEKGSCVAHLVLWSLWDHLQNQYPNWAFCTFSIFGVSFLLKKKEEEKSRWLINYSQGLLQLAYKMLKVREFWF
jgi:hypothetical protein